MEEAPSSNPRTKAPSFKTILCVLLALSVILNIILTIQVATKNTDLDEYQYVDDRERNYIDQNVQTQSTILHYSGLKSELETTIKEYGDLNNVGVFVQDIQTGSWMGINELKGFVPASLLKVPIMLAVLKNVERETIDLHTFIEIQESDITSDYIDVKQKKTGQTYSVAQLLEDMITYSDNTAKNALKRQITPQELDSVFTHVGIPNPYTSVLEEQTVSARNYIRLFKALYYHTYIDQDLSEFALELTTDTTTEDLLPGGVPSNIQVAHKFGIDIGPTKSSLHDCGIVYHPDNPYYICIMTENIAPRDAQTLINTLSRSVYTFVSNEE